MGLYVRLERARRHNQGERYIGRVHVNLPACVFSLFHHHKHRFFTLPLIIPLDWPVLQAAPLLLLLPWFSSQDLHHGAKFSEAHAKADYP